MKPENQESRLVRELLGVFVRLGFTAFGGPAAHIAMLHNEAVVRRKWLTDEEFLDLLGATNLIPGPNSTEMALHIGYKRAGLPGLLLAGAGFILPAVAIVLTLAVVYVRLEGLPTLEWLLVGVKPVVIAIVLNALLALGKKAIRGGWAWLLAGSVLGLYLLGWNEILLLVLGGAAAVMVRRVWKAPANMGAAGWLALPTFAGLGAALVERTLPLFLIFLKIGSVLYGSGYVLLAFLRADFVTRLGWLTDTQLIDAIAIGQVTPGPVFTSATFVGYLAGGWPGALAATVGIFLPSFVFVVLVNPLIPRLRQSAFFGALLDGVNIASLGLMAAVTLQLGQAALVDVWTLGLGVVSLAILLRTKLNPTWLILAGLLLGGLRALF